MLPLPTLLVYIRLSISFVTGDCEMNQLARVSNVISDVVDRGLVYAIANYRIDTPYPLDVEENWGFWTDPKPAWLENFAKTSPPEEKRKAYLEKMLARDHAIGIEAHYDVSNEFYALFLDTRYRFYTCARFLSEDETLEQAQQNKAEYLRSLLNLSGHEKVLDLGCGWGSMLKFLQNSGHSGGLSGFTLSKEQLAYARKELGFNVFLKDFVSDAFENEPYDRIISIGSLEHVKPHELKGLYQKMYHALTPGGLAVHQFFSFNSESYPASAMILQMFFLGSLLALHSEHIQAAESAGFKITCDSLDDYKPTLRAWYKRLAANQDKALELVGLKTYNHYMTFFPIAWLFFQHQEATLHRMVMEK
ncbi:MAG: class I SAM-dependent methyltransferase [Chroococcales cyanobacterium]